MTVRNSSKHQIKGHEQPMKCNNAMFDALPPGPHLHNLYIEGLLLSLRNENRFTYANDDTFVSSQEEASTTIS